MPNTMSYLSFPSSSLSVSEHAFTSASPTFPEIFSLSSLNGVNGFKLDGETAFDYSGYSVSAAGDLNGDGYADLVIGAYYYNIDTNHTGRSYVVFGGPDVGNEGALPLSDLNGVNGFKLDGEASHDASGQCVSTIADINSDGYDDLLIGSPDYNNHTGRSYVVFGGPTVGKEGVIPLSNLNGTNGFKLDGEASYDESGRSLSAAGDVNGDGYVDLLIGAPSWVSTGFGRSYVVFGGPSIGSEGLVSLSSLNGSNGFRLDGEVIDDQSGWSVSTAGDINGDGVTDLFIGAYGYNNLKGRSYVVFGGPNVGNSGTLPLASLNGTNGFKLEGEAIYDGSGYSISTAGDINGDGITDLLIGSFGHNSGTGRGYVVFGGVGIENGEILFLSSLNGTNGFKLDGETTGDRSGRLVSAAGDINGDEIADIFIGASYHDNQRGRGYVVFGGPEVGNEGILSLSNLNGSNGFKIDGEVNYDQSAWSASAVGDVNGDGITDLLIGAYNHSEITGAGYYVGRSYVVFGDTSQILLNQLTIHPAETVILTVDNLNATGTVIPTFNISNIQYGRFELSSSPGQAITEFNQSQIIAGQIQFIHDGSQLAPTYTVQASSRIAFSIQEANITFYPQPILTTNTLVIHQGEKLLMTPSLLNVTEEYYPPDQVNFTISDLQYGKFQLAPFNTSIMQFSQQQLLAGQVFFIQDNSPSAPSYQVEVSDPYFILPPISATVTFYREPVLVNNQLSINQGQSLLMTSLFLNITNEDYPDDQVNFTMSKLQYGQFQLAPLNVSVTQFSERQLLTDQVFFVHDNSSVSPSYQVSVSDPYFTLAPTFATVTFYRKPTLISNPISIYQGKSLVMTSALLKVIDDYPADQVNFIINDMYYGWFELSLMPNVPISQFTEQQLLAGQVVLVQDGGSSAPTYQVGVKDPYFTLPPVTAEVTLLYPSSNAAYDLKTWISVAGSLSTLLIGTLGYLLRRRYLQKKREFEHPFADKIHQHLGLSYKDFSHNEGKQYAEGIDRLVSLLEQKSDPAVSLDQLRKSKNPKNQARYQQYAYLFAEEIRAANVTLSTLECCAGKSMNLTELNGESEHIVNEVIQRAATEQPLAPSGWCAFFSCYDSLSHRKSPEPLGTPLLQSPSQFSKT